MNSTTEYRNSLAPSLDSNSNFEEIEYESFEAFGSRAYLEEYYSTIDYENDELLKFYARNYREIGKVKSVLEFSGGPTVYSLISAVVKAEEIHFSDYLAHNRHEVRRWLRGHKQAFDWNHFIKRVFKIFSEIF